MVWELSSGERWDLNCSSLVVTIKNNTIYYTNYANILKVLLSVKAETSPVGDVAFLAGDGTWDQHPSPVSSLHVFDCLVRGHRVKVMGRHRQSLLVCLQGTACSPQGIRTLVRQPTLFSECQILSLVSCFLVCLQGTNGAISSSSNTFDLKDLLILVRQTRGKTQHVDDNWWVLWMC